MKEETKTLQKRGSTTGEGIERTRARRVYRPDVDIIEKRNELLLVADMPGVDEKSIEVNLEEDILTIRGSVEVERLEGYKAIISEYGIGDYERSFTISDEIDRDKVKASLKDGVLRVILPKVESIRAKKIPITTE
ncbi:MAG: Hsp20/alpha crystallin family protein [Thermodesulfovibrionia bacterium]